MEEHDLLPVTPMEAILPLGWLAIMLVVLVASYRRNRHLFGRTVGTSLAVGLVSAVFWPFWIIGSITSRRAIAARWREHRAPEGERARGSAEPAATSR